MAKLTKAELEMLGIEESNNNVTTTTTVETTEEASPTPTASTWKPTDEDEEERERLLNMFKGQLVTSTIRGEKVWGYCENAYNTPWGVSLGIVYQRGKEEWCGALASPTATAIAQGKDAEKARRSTEYYCEMETASLRGITQRLKANGKPTTREEYMLKRIERIRERIA